MLGFVYSGIILLGIFCECKIALFVCVIAFQVVFSTFGHLLP